MRGNQWRVRLQMEHTESMTGTSTSTPTTQASAAPDSGPKVTETIRPGVITFTLGHGHWSTGAEDVSIDGKVIKGDKRRAAGVHANAAMWVDPHLKNTCMIDKVGGSVSFYDTKVKLVKV